MRTLSQAYLSRKEPEEKVAVVSLIHSEVASETLAVPSRERSNQAQVFS